MRLGGFDETLGAGRTLAGAEDLDMFCRVIADGGVVSHAPEAIVIHANTRLDEDYVRLLRGYGAGLGGLIGKWFRLDPVVGARLTGRVVRRSIRRALADRHDVLRRRGEVAMLLGVVDGARVARRLRIVGHRFVDASPPAPTTRSAPADASDTAAA